MSDAVNLRKALAAASRDESSTLLIHGMMIVATFLVATSFPVVAHVTGSLDSSVLTFIRFALATLLFAPIVAWHHGLKTPSLVDLLRYALLSVGLVSFFWCMFAALRTTTPLNTAAIFALTPVLVSVIAAIVLRERLGIRSSIALPIGAAGAVWVVFRGDLSALLSLQLGTGDLLFFAGTIALAGYSTLVKVLHRGEPMAQMTFWTLATGTFWLFLISIPALGRVDWPEVPALAFAGTAYLAVFTTIVTFFVFQWTTAAIGPTRVSAYTFLTPVFVLMIGLISGEDLPPLATWPGAVLVVASSLTLQTNWIAKPDRSSRKAASSRRENSCLGVQEITGRHGLST
ncbi:MAG: DMT family transporter [Pseudomonadota bacterium]